MLRNLIAVKSDSADGVVSSDTIMVAGAANGTIRSSTDGTTWTLRYTFSDNAAIGAIIYAAGLFVATNQNGKIATSPDGVTWTTRTSAITGQFLTLVHNGSFFLIVSYQNTVQKSTNGTTWTSVTTTGLPTADGQGVYDMVYAAGKFVVTRSNGGIYTSPDGVTWTLRGTPFVTGISRLTWTGTQFVASSPNRRYATSPDGVTWTLSAVDALPVTPAKITYFNSKYFLLAGDGRVYHSATLSGFSSVMVQSGMEVRDLLMFKDNYYAASWSYAYKAASSLASFAAQAGSYVASSYMNVVAKK